ncbi:hypothetical protein AQPE_0307 [Aquipluma nitroreducens]|uniref:Uncharacterized protein n=1 Tax=Aquipluma nitroreducens TaxID=2010828 RepID=A0A5K7S3X1_9BACT|nr:CehA/McbA family metallohydrolase [Aquipluma nitroreducens]BBE16170.1 hypothetical protein AQPE_0307 [Aquipluma nitroreducens]
MQKEKSNRLALRIAVLFLCLVPLTVVGQKSVVLLQIDGSKQFQKMDGFGVNINTAWWYNGEYGDTKLVQSAIDMLVDSLGATIFRAVIEEMDWEVVNDDNNPNNFNWAYYNKVFSNERFQGVWKTLRYLNQKGITNGLIISLMGVPPAAEPLAVPDKQKSWMGGTDYSINPVMEDEFVESIAALLYYARHTAKIKFSLVSPMNETEQVSSGKSIDHPDGFVEGPNIPDAVQFARIIKKLGKKLDAIGMSDIRFVSPDAAGDHLFALCLGEMVKDPYIMSKLDHWGVHDYGNNAGNYNKIVGNPVNPNKSFWVTEMAGIGNMLGQLGDNAHAYIFWDGFDCVYQHARRNGSGSTPPNDWVFWQPDDGKPMIEYIPSTKSWMPRKQFYEFAQVYKFIKPGATRISSMVSDSSVVVRSFLNPNGQLVIVGRNSGKRNITINGIITNLPAIDRLKLTYTTPDMNFYKSADIILNDDRIKTSLPPNCVFTLTGFGDCEEIGSSGAHPEPSNWYAGDMHVHRDCGGAVSEILPENKLKEMMEVNDLAVISVLADMGDAEVKPSEIDLPKVNGKDSPLSCSGRIIHYDAEWHWDPAGTTFEYKALGGHVVLLGLTEAHQIWDESPYKILEYGRKHNGIVGFCHTEYLNDQIQNYLNCCIPIEYPVEAALGMLDFFSEDVYGTQSHNNGNYSADATINAYYKLLNCGIRLGLCAGTDYPCNLSEPFGTLLTYSRVDGALTYRKWIEAIRDGRTVVSRNGHLEFIDMKVNGKYQPGDEIKMKNKGTVSVEVKWTSVKPLTGTLELVFNGKVVAKQEGTAQPETPVILKVNQVFAQSGWLCARRIDENGHQTHTAPVYVTVNNKPVRASSEDAQYFVKWIDNLIEKTSPGNDWNKYFTHDLNIVQGRYKKAKSIYLKIAEEARSQNN